MTIAATWFHAAVKGMSRGQGRSAVAAAAYRTGENYRCEREGRDFDYSRRRREGLVGSFTLLPDGADPSLATTAALWNAAERAEKRKDAKVARELELALPHNAAPEVRQEIATRVAKVLIDRYRVGVTVALHAPPLKENGEAETNWHAHIMMTTREVTAEGLGQKTRVLDQAKTSGAEVRWIRERCAWIINDALEKAGSEERVTHRSLLEQGIVDRLPQQHRGPSLDEIERRGELTPEERLALRRYEQDRYTHDFLSELVTELAEVDAQIAAREESVLDEKYGRAEGEADGRSVHSANRDAEIVEAVLDQVMGTRQDPEPERPATPRPAEANSRDERVAAQHDEARAQIENEGAVADVRQDGQSWWQRGVAQVRTRARQLRDMVVRSWEHTKETWQEWTRYAREGKPPDDIRRDINQGRGPER